MICTRSYIQKDLGGVKEELGEVRKVAESAGSQASAANETLRSLTARVAALEKGGPAGGSGGLWGSAARRGAGSAPPTRGEPVAKVGGFPLFTMKEEIEERIDAILKELSVECKDRFGVGRRGDYGLVVFQDQGKLQDFLKKTDGKSYDYEAEGGKVALKVTRKGDPVWLEATKHERSLLKVLGNMCGIPRETKDKKILDADYKARKVFFGRRVAGEFEENCEFVVRVGNINNEAKRLGKQFTGEEVQDELVRVLSE
jgi:hypothetical protein